jgi:CheY-like chemotaxis protein
MKTSIVSNIINKLNNNYCNSNYIDPFNDTYLPNILLVEDNSINQKVAVLLLKQMGFNNIDIASSGIEAINLSIKNRYSLILLDIGLPDLDGFEVAKIIRNDLLNITIPIIAVTAFDRDDIEKRSSEVGINQVLNKPLMMEDLEKTLLAYLRNKNILKMIHKSIKA